MKLPKLPQTRARSKAQIIAFGGVNLTEGVTPGELCDSEGLTATRYPALSVRSPRAVEGSYVEPTGVYAKDKLCVLDGSDFYYGGQKVGVLLPGEKQFATVNTKLCIWPDKRYLDTSNPSSLKWGYIDASVTAVAGTVTFTTSKITLAAHPVVDEITFTAYTEVGKTGSDRVKAYNTAPFNSSTNRWTTTGAATYRVKMAPKLTKSHVLIPYKDASGKYKIEVRPTVDDVEAGVNDFVQPLNTDGVYGHWTGNEYDTSGPSGYITSCIVTLYNGKVQNENLTQFFKVGDVVKITGCTSITANNKQATVRGVTSTSITFDANTFTEGSEAAGITIARPMPDIHYICEHENRLWGVGGDAIYASALGDPTNFNVFDGL